MLRRHRVSATALLLIGAGIFGAPALRAAADWPPIAPEDLAMKESTDTPGAAAMILYREEILSAAKSSDSYYYRVKVFSEGGRRYGDVEISYFRGLAEIKEIEGRTIHSDGTIVPFDGQVLDRTLVKFGEFRYLAKTFSLPSITPGSIIEYRYKVQHSAFFGGAQWQLQEGLYTKRAHFAFAPMKSFSGLTIRTMSPDRRNIAPKKKPDGSFELDIDNVQGLPEEQYMLPASELRGRVEFIYSGEIHFPAAKDYWDRNARFWVAEDEQFIGKDPHTRELAAQLVSPSDPAETKLRKFYARVQQLRSLDDRSDKTVQEILRDKTKANFNIDDVLKHGYAFNQQIDLFLVALAQASGYEAGLVWVAPRDKNTFHPEDQDKTQLGAPLAWIRAGDAEYFLDPAAKLCPFGLLPWDKTETSGMRPTKNGAVFFQTPRPPSSSSTTERIVHLELGPDGSLSGTLTVRFTRQRSLIRRTEAREQDETGRNKLITDEIKNWLPASAKFDLTGITGWDKSDSALEAQGKLRIPEMTESAGKRMLLPVGLYEATQRQYFESAARKQDVYFPYPFEEVDDITLQLPAGWTADSLPAPQTLDPGGYLNFEISVKPEGGALHIHRRLAVGKILYQVGVYSVLRNFFTQAKVDDEQQLVLQTGSAARN
jgi:hypothetical protein